MQDSPAPSAAARPPAPSRGPRCLVVGAGLAGLAAARELVAAGWQVALWEADEQAGGVVRSRSAAGYLFELGPNTVPQSAETLLALVQELGLAGELVTSTAAARRRFVFLQGRLQALPATPFELLRTPVLSAAGKLRLLSERLRGFEPPGPGEPEPSFHELIAARFGLEVAERLAGAFVRGIYAGDARKLGARSAFPRLWGLLERHGGVLAGLAAAAREQRGAGPALSREQRRARASLISLRGGFGRLVEALATGLGPRLHLGRAAVKIAWGPGAPGGADSSAEGTRARGPALSKQPAPGSEATPLNPAGPGSRLDSDRPAGAAAERNAAAREPSGSLWVTDQRGHTEAFERVLLALPAPAAAALLGQLAPGCAAELAAVRHAAVHTVHLGIGAAELTNRAGTGLPAGFGFLVAPGELGEAAPRCLGALFPSQIFDGRAPAGKAGISLFYAAESLAAAGGSIAEVGAEDLRRALGLQARPRPELAFDIAWPQGIAQAEIGHRERIGRARAALRREAPGVALAGGYVGGVSVEDTLKGGRAAARELLAGAPVGPRS